MKIGEEVSERLDFTPSTLFVRQTVRPKYVVRFADQPDQLRVADLPLEALPKSTAAPGLVADVIVSKCVDHLPLYRQEKRYARQGVDLSRSTLCGCPSGHVVTVPGGVTGRSFGPYSRRWPRCRRAEPGRREDPSLSRPDGHREKHVLMTTLLDADAHPAIEVILAYHQRWEEESLFDEQKTHHDPVRPGKPRIPGRAARRRACRTGGTCWRCSLGHFVTQALRCNSPRGAQAEGIDPDRISFTGTLRVLRCRLPECDPDRSAVVRARLVSEPDLGKSAGEQIEPRRNRTQSPRGEASGLELCQKTPPPPPSTAAP